MTYFFTSDTQKLPVLERKWNRINENYINKMEKSKFHKRMVFKMFNEGYRNKDIAEKLKLYPSAITLITQRNKGWDNSAGR